MGRQAEGRSKENRFHSPAAANRETTGKNRPRMYVCFPEDPTTKASLVHSTGLLPKSAICAISYKFSYSVL